MMPYIFQVCFSKHQSMDSGEPVLVSANFPDFDGAVPTNVKPTTSGFPRGTFPCSFCCTMYDQWQWRLFFCSRDVPHHVLGYLGICTRKEHACMDEHNMCISICSDIVYSFRTGSGCNPIPLILNTPLETMV